MMSSILPSPPGGLCTAGCGIDRVISRGADLEIETIKPECNFCQGIKLKPVLGYVVFSDGISINM